MTRDEEIIQASDEWTYQKPPQYSELVYNTHKTMCAYQIGFIDGAVWADRHPHWISVEDELPPIDGGFSDEVLTYDSATNEYKIAQFNYISGCWFGCDDNVTHWMPLSEPPKKGGEQ